MEKINRQDYIDIMETNTRNKTCHTQIPMQNSDFINDLSDEIYEMAVHVSNTTNICSGAEWLLGLNMYKEDLKGSYLGKYKNKSIERGRIIEFDVFGNVSSEQKKKRPAIVLLENGSMGLIVAPISKSAYKSGKPYHISLDRNVNNLGNMKDNCGIKLDQIRYIDKNRVTGKFRKVTDSKKLDEIDEKIARNLSRSFYFNYQTMQSTNEKLNHELVKLSKEVSDKDDEIEKLNRKIKFLNKELENVSVIDKNNVS